MKFLSLVVDYFMVFFLSGYSLVKDCRSWVNCNNVIRGVVFVLVGALLPLMSSAQDVCAENTSEEQSAQCAQVEMKIADAKLNESYKAVIDRAESRYIFQYQSQPELNKVFLGKLKDSQRAWIKLRDTNCSLEGFENEWDKVLYTANLNKCIARMSLDRAKYLDAIIPSR